MPYRHVIDWYMVIELETGLLLLWKKIRSQLFIKYLKDTYQINRDIIGKNDIYLSIGKCSICLNKINFVCFGLCFFKKCSHYQRFCQLPASTVWLGSEGPRLVMNCPCSNQKRTYDRGILLALFLDLMLR